MKSARTRTLIVLAGLGLLTLVQAREQSVLFDFDNAPLYSPLPIDLTVGGITAHLSATGQGYSIQSASTAPVVPIGFTGRFIYPSSVYAADLLVGFSQTLTDFSILYAPQELGCDDSATMKVTAYLDGGLVGTNTATASQPGTWPVATLSFASAQGFNRVVVHYQAKPPTCQDWGPIFLADDMTVTPAPTPILLTDEVRLASGEFQFSFTNPPGRSFTVLATTNLSLPLGNWTALGGLREVLPGQFQFTDSRTNGASCFYRVRSP